MVELGEVAAGAISDPELYHFSPLMVPIMHPSFYNNAPFATQKTAFDFLSQKHPLGVSLGNGLHMYFQSQTPMEIT